jgi:[ribosomal protein S5]-alanine N-acetyltransferase
MPIDIAFESFPILETERLILREARLSDTPEMFINMSDMDVMRQIGTGYVHQIEEESRKLLRKVHGWYASKEVIRWVITLKGGDDKLLGTLGFHEFSYGANKFELGYELNKQYWGQGITSEAVLRILRYGFDVMEAQRIEAATDGINERSHNLLKRLGFTQEACLRRRVHYFDTYWDEYWFGLLVEEFNSIHKK